MNENEKRKSMTFSVKRENHFFLFNFDEILMIFTWRKSEQLNKSLSLFFWEAKSHVEKHFYISLYCNAEKKNKIAEEFGKKSERGWEK